MKGKILREIECEDTGKILFRQGQIIECGYHTQMGKISDEKTDFICVRQWLLVVPEPRCITEVDFLTSADVIVLGEVI
ncbi:hypothetical protein [Nostoc sp. MS1]|uniref:hypothetical protein n=1 Tax=Nostoc sp. MS1 TaxID=2764711 RepID=UPI001CC65CBC|nr:hypothetical protein [Nostoc sp. MS1]BCL40018.1 hypothetical protein NSMS1_64650 [Nostoc sp. MS1]